MVEITFPNGTTKVARTLLDTGTILIILKNSVHGSQVHQTTGRLTNMTAKVNFKIPEWSTSTALNWTCHLEEHTKAEYLPCNLILGLELLAALKIGIDFIDQTIK